MFDCCSCMRNPTQVYNYMISLCFPTCYTKMKSVISISNISIQINAMQSKSPIGSQPLP